MSVYRPAKSTNWLYDFQVRRKRYHGSTGTASKSAAKEFVRKLRNEIAEGRQDKPDITMDEAFGYYWQQRGQHEKSGYTTKKQMDRMLAHFGKSTLLRDLDRVEIDRYIAKRRGMKARNSDRLVSNATVNRETQLLKRVINRVPDSYAKPVIDWRKIMLREAQGRVRELSSVEEASLFDSLPSDLAAVVEFAMLSGQRRSSVLTLLWSKVDLIGMRAEVRMKGDIWHKFPLTPRMAAIIRDRPKVCPQVFTYECERPSPPRGDRARRLRGERYPFSRDGWRRKWARALEVAGIDDFRFHDLRHTGATRLVRASGNLKVAQKLLGHTTITTTARYAHAAEDDVRSALLLSESRNSPEHTTEDDVKNRRNPGRAA